MKSKQQEATIDAVNVMIRHADKGPSGFWVEDYEGCGNPAIFPEFKEGLEHGKFVRKECCLCPWNTAVMYGSGHGNISTGCYHSCSIGKARYLTVEELKEVLTRFKLRMEKGEYDCVNHLSPLLTEYECKHIEDRILAERQERQLRDEQKRQDRLEKAATLVAKYPDKKFLLAAHYGENDIANVEGGPIFFNPNSQKDVVGAEKMSYDEYLDIQLASLGHAYRSGLTYGIFYNPLTIRGQIEKIKQEHICFKRLFISGVYPDGEIFEAHEDHVWMDPSGFEEYGVGDSVSFVAEIYRYVKTGNGKLIDYGLRNPEGIQKISAYELPGDDELRKQTLNEIICETCYLSDHCNRVTCILINKRSF